VLEDDGVLSPHTWECLPCALHEAQPMPVLHTRWQCVQCLSLAAQGRDSFLGGGWAVSVLEGFLSVWQAVIGRDVCMSVCM
jgi:hypothetical protein